MTDYGYKWFTPAEVLEILKTLPHTKFTSDDVSNIPYYSLSYTGDKIEEWYPECDLGDVLSPDEFLSEHKGDTFRLL
jgi:hypothetical protein